MPRLLNPFVDILSLITAMYLSNIMAGVSGETHPLLDCRTQAFNIFLFIVIFLITLHKLGLYTSIPRRQKLEYISEIFSASLLAFLIYIALAFLMGICPPLRKQSFLLIGITTILLIGGRLALQQLYIRWKKKYDYNFNILVVGSRERAKETIEALFEYGSSDFRIIGCFDPEKNAVGRMVTRGVKVIGTMDEYYDFLIDNVVDEVIFAMPLSLLPDALDFLSFTDELGINVKILPNWQLHEMAYQPRNAIIDVRLGNGIPYRGKFIMPANVSGYSLLGVNAPA